MTRKQLEARAKKLKVQFKADDTDEALQAAIATEEAAKKAAAEDAKAAKALADAEKAKQSKPPLKSDDPDLVVAKAKYRITHNGEDVAIGEEFLCTEKQRDALVASKSAVAVD